MCEESGGGEASFISSSSSSSSLHSPRLSLHRTSQPAREHHTMAIRLRLSRHALTRNNPSYSLVATRSSSRPTAQPLEHLGDYSPVPTIQPAPSRSPNGRTRPVAEWGASQFAPRTAHAQVGVKQCTWNLDRVRFWLSQGAIPSKSVERLLVQAGVLGPSPRPPPSSPPPLGPALTLPLSYTQTPTRGQHRPAPASSCRGNGASTRPSGPQRRSAARCLSRSDESATAWTSSSGGTRAGACTRCRARESGAVSIASDPGS